MDGRVTAIHAVTAAREQVRFVRRTPEHPPWTHGLFHALAHFRPVCSVQAGSWATFGEFERLQLSKAGQSRHNRSGLAAFQSPRARIIQRAITDADEDEPVMKAVAPAGPELDLVAGDPVAAPEIGDGDVGGVTAVRPLCCIPRVGILQTRPTLDDLRLA